MAAAYRRRRTLAAVLCAWWGVAARAARAGPLWGDEDEPACKLNSGSGTEERENEPGNQLARLRSARVES